MRTGERGSRRTGERGKTGEREETGARGSRGTGERGSGEVGREVGGELCGTGKGIAPRTITSTSRRSGFPVSLIGLVGVVCCGAGLLGESMICVAQPDSYDWRPQHRHEPAAHVVVLG